MTTSYRERDETVTRNFRITNGQPRKQKIPSASLTVRQRKRKG